MDTATIGLDITEFERSWREMLDRMEELPPHVQRASRALTMLRSVFSSLGVGLGIGGLVAFTKSVLNFARETSDAAKTAGVLPETLQRIQAALSRKLSADDATAALVSLNHALRDAKSGSVDAQDKLAQLGVTFNDIKTKTPDEILLQLADHVKDAIDPVEALREVTNLFGADLASKLTPALKGGSAAMKEMGDSASVASDQMIESAASGARALERLGKVAKQTALEAVDFWSRVRFTMNGPVPSLSLKGRGGSVAKTPHTIDVEARVSAAKAAANTGDAGNKNAKQISANNADQLTAEKDLLATQAKIAFQVAPEYVKQSEKLVAEYERLQSQLTSARGLERDKLELQKAQNVEARNALYFAQKARESEITLNTTKAKLGESFNDRQKGFLAEIRDIDNQIYIARFKGDKQAVAALMLRRRDKAAEAIDDQFDHQAELSSLRLQTSEVMAQSKGLKSVAEQARIIAQYDTEIAKQKKAQNVEAVKLLENQKKLAQRDADAAQHDETPAERRKARHKDQVLNRKAKQQRERDAAALRERNGLITGGIGIGANPHGPGLRMGGLNDPSVSFAAQEARAKLQLKAQGAQMQLAAWKAVMDIARAVTSDK